jgi:hypothetical protein
MAEMMETLQKRLEFAFLGGRFWTFAQIGAVIILLTSFKPFFIAYAVPALVVLAVALTWDLWRNAPKSVRYLLALVPLAVGIWLLVNTLVMLVEPMASIAAAQEAADALEAAGLNYDQAVALNLTTYGGLVEGIKDLLPNLAAMYGGLIGQLLLIVSGLMGLMAARRA